jgi:hypothetical protein
MIIKPWVTLPILSNHLGGGPVVRAWDQEVCSLCGLRFEPYGYSYDGQWRLTWSLTSGPVRLVEVRASGPDTHVKTKKEKAVVLGFAELRAFLLAHERWGGRYGSRLFEPTSIHWMHVEVGMLLGMSFVEGRVVLFFLGREIWIHGEGFWWVSLALTRSGDGNFFFKILMHFQACLI